MSKLLFPIGLFLSAILLFSIQPMVAKSLLPHYGGTPAVWTICMLFFQFMLLLAYGYVWLLSSIQTRFNWRLIHCILIAISLTSIPLLLKPIPLDGQPEWSIIYNLMTQLGLPLLVIAASAPLLQFAYSQTKSKGATDPYFLYSASNLGSLLSLVSYPFLIERYIGLTTQYNLWTIGFILYLSLLMVLFFTNKYTPIKHKNSEKTTWPWYSMGIWVFLSFVPCSLMLGVTLFISTDVAATPLFWVIPLALYLLTFVIAFSNKPIISQQWIVRNSLFFLLFPIIGFILGISGVRAWQTILVNLLSFFVLALLCHGELYRRRPEPQLLTLFYFCLAIGGVLAGIFNGIIAPHIFNQIYEYPISILLCLLLLPATNTKQPWIIPLIILGLFLLLYILPDIHWPKGFSTLQVICLIVLVIIVLTKHSRMSLFSSMLVLFIFICSPIAQKTNILLQERDFYGVKQVLDKNGVHVLISQSTVHGLQPSNEKKPVSGFRSYYGALEHVIKLMQDEHPSMSVTIMGLGAGTMVCQHRSTDHLNLIEIDNQMIDLAKNPNFFTYLRDCSAQTEIIKDDGRIASERLRDRSQNLFVLDAFNSDAIPVHLLTLEAFNLYKRKLTHDGVILVNVSNRHLGIVPVLTAIGRSLDFMVFFLAHTGDPKLGQFNSEWALLTTNQDFAFKLMNGTNWQFVADNKEVMWTDDYSNIVPLLRW